MSASKGMINYHSISGSPVAEVIQRMKTCLVHKGAFQVEIFEPVLEWFVPALSLSSLP
jgi:hypothetical protein